MRNFCLIKILPVLIILYSPAKLYAQNVETDSLKKRLAITHDDIKRVDLLEGLSYAYLASFPDTAMQYALQGLQLANNINDARGKAACTDALGNVYFHTGDNAKALEMYLKFLTLKEDLKDKRNISVAYYNIASAYTEEKDYVNALSYIYKAKAEDEKKRDSAAILYDLYSLGSIYVRMAKNDSALYYTEQCFQFARQLDDKNMAGAVLNLFGEIYLALSDSAKAIEYYRRSIPLTEAVNDNEVLTSNYFGLAKIFRQKRMPDSSIYYARKACLLARDAPFFKQVLETSTFLTEVFAAEKKFDSAYFYQKLGVSIKDSLFNAEEVRKVQNMKMQEQQRQNAIEAAQVKFRNRIKLFAALFSAFVLLITALILGRNYKRKKAANAMLKQQKQQIETALTDLKSTQAQLIQSEKMASLGELTAGIAHEIQNPLNFVTNFSEVNVELIDELKAERSKPVSRRDEETEAAILNSLVDNMEKISHHGKRADGIVKGMLQHSRNNRGQKESTDINGLCEEYLRLAYHGVRAKDKSFNAAIKTDFDQSIEKIDIVPPDIGRVILNLLTNAFYAVKEKAKLPGSDYQPSVGITTKKIDNRVEISVSDNGNGISQSLVDKIFQPFFTTKPAGQGTGLGLSLAYDIVKAHNGELTVETSDGEGSVFRILLPQT